MIPTTRHSGKDKTIETVKDQRLWREGRCTGNEQAERRENTPYDVIMMDTRHYTFVLTHLYYTKSEP